MICGLQVIYSIKLDKSESILLRVPADSPAIIIKWIFYDKYDKLLFIDKETFIKSVKFINSYV